MTTRFALDPRLAAATLPLAETDACLVRVMNDRRYPWIVLVPTRAGAEDLSDFDAEERLALVERAAAVAARMTVVFAATKINIATLGNRVRQFHLHIVARQTGDLAWPNGIWDGSAPEPYAADAIGPMLQRMQACLMAPV